MLFSLKKYKENLIKVSTWVLFLACFIGFFQQSHVCFKKYLQKPQAMEVINKYQKDIDFPSISLCPLPFKFYQGGKPSAYNWTTLNDCEIDFENGIFVGSKMGCNDSKILWESLTPQLDDFGYISGFITYQDFENALAKGKKDIQKSLWKKNPSYYNGACITLDLPKEMVENGIFSVNFYVDKDKKFEVYLHGKSLMNLVDPMRTVEHVRKLIHPDFDYIINVNYHQDQHLKNGCSEDENYDRFECLKMYADQKTAEIGCKTPFQNDLDKVCNDSIKGKSALQAFSKAMGDYEVCPYPCKYLSSFTITWDYHTSESESRQVTLVYRDLIKVNTAKITYSGVDLFAAIGGYIGLFLGLSIFQIKDGVGFILRKISP